MNYLNQLQDLSKIYYCIGLAESKIKYAEKCLGDEFFHLINIDIAHEIEILTASIKRLEERQSKLSVAICKRNVTKTP